MICVLSTCGETVDNTLVTLFKDSNTHAKGHLPNEDIIIWPQVLGMPLIPPLTIGHLSNEAIIIWQNECPSVSMKGGLLYHDIGFALIFCFCNADLYIEP